MYLITLHHVREKNNNWGKGIMKESVQPLGYFSPLINNAWLKEIRKGRIVPVV